MGNGPWRHREAACSNSGVARWTSPRTRGTKPRVIAGPDALADRVHPFRDPCGFPCPGQCLGEVADAGEAEREPGPAGHRRQHAHLHEALVDRRALERVEDLPRALDATAVVAL